MLTPRLSEIFRRFNETKVLIVGDVMIDSYLWGRVDRISPEAPVPVVSVTKAEYRLGGAANVALNISSLGAEPIICSVVGNDDKANIFDQLLRESGLSNEGICRSDNRPTTIKTRVISNGQHLLRVDEEKTDLLNAEEEILLQKKFEELVTRHQIDVVIFQDYNKGVLTERVIEACIEKCRQMNIPTAVDPKKDHFLSYRHADLFKPNLKELREGVKAEFDDNFEGSLKNAIHHLEAQLQNRISLVTLSERGMVCSTDNRWIHIPAHPRKIIDVSGAGDTVISVAALCLAQKLEPELLVRLSNLAGGLVCENVGVVPIDKNALYGEASLLHPVR